MPFKIVRNDITKMCVDAIVNTANPKPVYASGSDSAVYKAAGAEELLIARKQIGVLETGQAAITPAFALHAKYIIHTVGPVFRNGNEKERESLFACYDNCLNLALKNKCESIAFPLISTGVYGYPKDQALQVALAAIGKFLAKEEMMIYLVVFDEESFSFSRKMFSDIDAYIDENYVQESLAKEYIVRETANYGDVSLQSGRMAEILPYFNEGAVDKQTDDLNLSRPLQACQEAAAEKTSVKVSKGQKAKTSEKTTKKPSKLTFWKREGRGSQRSLDEVMLQLEETFQERLLRMIDERGLTDVEVYKKANLSRKLFSKIRCNPDYRPKKMTAVALAIAMELNLDETKDLLARAELALSPSSKFDVIIKYFIEQEIYDIFTINVALFEYGQPTIGE